jgi:hypothetical protein
MKKEHWILLSAGVVLAVIIIAARKKKLESLSVIRPGDKGGEVAGLQNALTSLTGVKLSNPGLYDNETLSAVQYYLNGCNALQDYAKGFVSRSFALDLMVIQENAKGS